MLIKCLIADDQNGDVISRILEMHNGFEFTVVNNGSQAVQQSLRTEADFDILLLDVMLPETDGLTALEVIKRQRPSFPVVVMSTAGRYRREALALGADDSFVMPNDYGVMARRLTELVCQFRRQHAGAGGADNNGGERLAAHRRLAILRERSARMGEETPPSVIIEIEDLEAELKTDV